MTDAMTLPALFVSKSSQLAPSSFDRPNELLVWISLASILIWGGASAPPMLLSEDSTEIIMCSL
eukprot:scaffold9736_cov144-Skeletonema_marinoi.AAC.13